MVSKPLQMVIFNLLSFLTLSIKQSDYLATFVPQSSKSDYKISPSNPISELGNDLKSQILKMARKK